MLVNLLQVRRHYKKYTHPRYADLAQEVLLIRPADARRRVPYTTLIRAMIGDCDQLPNPKRLTLELTHQDHGVWTVALDGQGGAHLCAQARGPQAERRLKYNYKSSPGALLLWQGPGMPPPMTNMHLEVAQAILDGC